MSAPCRLDTLPAHRHGAPHPATRGYAGAMTDWAVPRSWTPLRFWDQLERRRDTRAGLVVILDSATASHYHHPRCEHVAEAYFEIKRANDWRNGAYFWIDDGSQAAGYATPCAVCGGEPLLN